MLRATLFLVAACACAGVGAQVAQDPRSDEANIPAQSPVWAGVPSKADAGNGIPATPRPMSAGDETFLRAMDGQQNALRERGAAATDLPAGPPRATLPLSRAVTPAKPANASAAMSNAGKTVAKPEPAPTIDADLAAIAETEGMAQPPQGESLEATKTVVFISLSMPKQTIKTLFQQARGRADVLFLVRGWTPPHFTIVTQTLKQLMVDAGGMDINVAIDPYPFRSYHIKQVPVFLHERKGGDWRRVTGEIGLDRAIDEIERGNFNRTLGATYKIAEPDIVEEIQKRGAAFDWDKEKARIAERYATNMDGSKPLVNLPRVEVSREFYVDPSITLLEDVTDINGKVLAPKGMSINPFATVTFSKSFIAFNPDDAKQLALAQRWAKEFAPVMLLATHLPTPVKNKPTLAQLMGQSVYPLSPELIDRMGIVAVPSLIRQQGMALRINEQKP